MDGKVLLEDAKAKLEALPPKPSTEDIAQASLAISEIEKQFTQSVEDIIQDNAVQDQAEAKLLQGARLASAKAEADSLRVKHLSVLSLAEKHAHYEKIIAKLQFAAIVEDDTSETDLAKQETTRKVLSEIDNVVAQNKLEVDWNGWQLRVLPENFGQMHSLLHLNLSENFLESIPDSIAGLVNLRVLDISNNFLKSLPDSIGALRNLEQLNASKNQLVKLPDTLWNCGNLEELNVFFNKLEYLPAKFCGFLLRLKNLNLGFNKLRSLPEDIGKLSELTHLDAHFNRIQKVPDSIGELTKLEFLDLSENFADLVKLPSSLGNLFHLRVLKLQNNQISELPVEIGRLSQLDELALEGNPWTEPPYVLVKKNDHDELLDYLQRRYRASLEEESPWFSDWTKWISELLAGGNWQLANWLSAVMAGTQTARITGDDGNSSGQRPTEVGLLEMKEVGKDIEAGAKV